MSPLRSGSAGPGSNLVPQLPFFTSTSDNAARIIAPLREDSMPTAADATRMLRSSPGWSELLEEILPAQGEWSEELYLLLTDHRNRLVEFTDGFLEVLPMPTDKHQSVLKFLFLV